MNEFKPKLKYWKNQIPPRLDADHKGQLFMDPYFKPCPASIGQHMDMVNELEMIDWMPIRFIMANPKMFVGSIEAQDILQGNLGNCYFLSAISAFAEFPSYLESLFITKEYNEFGYYEIQLFIDGEWQIVFLDSYFPVVKGTKKLKFSQANQEELWMILLEKAWSKINSSYSNTISGWPSDPFVVFTGASCEKHSIAKTDKSELWKILESSDKQNFIMCASTGDGPSNEFIPSNYDKGLISNHAYTLISAHNLEDEFKNKIMLLKIRNPWGNREWNGNWSDNSCMWTDKLKAQANLQNSNDGFFFIDIDDFVAYFQVLNICNFDPMSTSTSFVFNSQEDFVSPKVFHLSLAKPGLLSIGCFYPHWRYNRDRIIRENPTSVLLARINAEAKEETLIHLDFTDIELISGRYASKDNAGFSITVEEGNYLIIVISPIMAEATEKERMTLKVSSRSNFLVGYIDISEEVAYNCLNEVIIGYLIKHNEKYFNQKPFFIKTENQLLSTGLAYRIIQNNTLDTILLWDNDYSAVEGIYILDAYIGVQKRIFPNTAGIFIGLKSSEFGTYWLNIKSSSRSLICDQSIGKREKKTFPLKLKMSYDVELHSNGYEEYSPFHYATTLMSAYFSGISFSKLNDLFKAGTVEVEIKKLLLALPRYDCNTTSNTCVDLEMRIKEYPNGVYYGEFNSSSRHGRGIYFYIQDKVLERIFYGFYSNGKRIHGGLLKKDGSFQLE